MTSIEKIRRVKIKQGELEGTFENLLSGRIYTSFKGIPYAKPPIGDLRFKAPQPPENWSGIRDASQHGNACPQIFPYDTPLEMDLGEDCLHLNVYTTDVKGPKAPVMVWFHGGAFYSGSGNSDIYGPQHLLEEGVVVVTANYRLEAFGFLCLDTPDIPGNAGLKDQVAVLRWVKDNIEYFGGDPGNVTIFGESAGGASVTYHLFSPMSEGLFHKVIAQSGCALNEWTLYNGKNIGLKAAKAIGNVTEDVNELTKFFKSVPTDELVGISLKMTSPTENVRGLKIWLSPTVEKKFDGQEAFLLKTPQELLAEGKYHKVPIVLGYCDKEGLLMTRNVNKKAEVFDSLKSRTPEIIRYNAGKDELKQIENKILEFYFKDKVSDEEVISAVADFESDVMFSYHITHFAKLLAKLSKNQVYLYRFCIDGTLNIPKVIMGLGKRKGTSHADDLFYLFYNNIEAEDGSVEWKTIKRMCKMWTNFAKFSNPTPQTETLIPVKWKPLSTSELNYLNIDCELTQEVNPDKERFDFWDEIYRNFPKKSAKSHL